MQAETIPASASHAHRVQGHLCEMLPHGGDLGKPCLGHAALGGVAAEAALVHMRDLQAHQPGTQGDVLVGKAVQDGAIAADVARHRARQAIHLRARAQLSCTRAHARQDAQARERCGLTAKDLLPARTRGILELLDRLLSMQTAGLESGLAVLCQPTWPEAWRI